MKTAKKKLAGASQSELVYADKVLGIGLGAAVSKVVLGLETPGVEEDTANITLVLPTHALLDLLELVDKSMKNDMALRSALTEQWEQLNNKFAGNSLNLTTLKLSPPKDE